jgi:hypothetical protein
MPIILIYSTDENSTPYQIMRNAINNGDIIDILELSRKFYDELKECFEEEDEYEDEIICPKELIAQMMFNRFKSCSEESIQMNEILETVGFNSQFAEDFASHIEDDPLDMSLWDWIHHLVVSTLDHLVKKCLPWKFDSYLEVERSYEVEKNTAKNFMKKDISAFLNGNFPKNIKYILAEEIGHQTFENLEFWFHATNLE